MPELVEAHQALYGYREGHRLLASSTSLMPEVQRSLRSFTDTSFAVSSGPYLAIHPLPAQHMQAFVRTWPAPDWIRPGSVWSHVVLVHNADVARFQGMGSLRKAFRKPRFEDRQISLETFDEYRTTLSLDTTEHVDISNLDSSFVAEVVYGLYGTTEPVRLQVGSAEYVESILLAVYEQQWPRLRRAFAARTRGRSSSTQLDLELVESRPRGADSSGQGGPGRDEPWVRRAVDDLIRPDPQYRSFLYLGGAESSQGRDDFSVLTRIFDAAVTVQGGPRSAVKLIAQSYPSPASHRVLKKTLLGPAVPDAATLPWPTTEAARIALAFEVGPAVAFDDLRIGERLVNLHRGPGGASGPLAELDIEALGPDNVGALVTAVTANADRTTALGVATTQPDLGLLIVTQNPALLSEPLLWDRLDNELLVDLLQELPNRRADIAAELLDRRATEPLARLCAAFPDEWWQLLRWAANAEIAPLVERAQTLRLVLERMGTAALDSPTTRPQSPTELVALLLAADLSSGLWRRARTSDWIATVTPPARRFVSQLPRFTQERLFTVVLVGAAGGTSAEHRRNAWEYAFGFLHRALASAEFDEEAWRLLATTLPAGPAWDRCHRLRRGAATEVRRDEWSASTVRSLLAEAHPHEGDLMDLLREQSNERKKKKDTFLRSLMKLLQ